MSLAIQTAKALAAIQADATLLSWARYSIRFNTGRTNQANDFISKLNAHGIKSPELANARAIAGALGKIEKDDRNN